MPEPTVPDLSRWRALVDQTLRGASFDRRMNRSLPGGLTLPALQTERPTDTSASHLIRSLSREGRWEVSAAHTVGTEGCVDAVHQDIQRGVDSIVVEGADDAADVAAVLAAVPLNEAGVVWSTGASVGARFEQLADASEKQGVAFASVWGAIGTDPFAAHLQSGASLLDPAGWQALARVTSARPKHLSTVAISGIAAREAGGSAATELGALLASGAATLRALGEAGLSVVQVAEASRLTVGIGRDQLVGIALLRATRLCWARLCAAFGATDAGATRAPVHGVQLRCWQTRHDPWVNLLRSTLAGFVGAVGGADAVTLLPYDVPGGAVSDAGRRMATNTQLVLAEESHLAAVRDPSAGSYAIEHLTLELARAAWGVMQSIEAAGGLEAAAGRDLLVARVAEERAALATQLDKRKAALVGVSDFPAAADQALPPSPDSAAGALAPIRHARAWEDLRDAGEARPDLPPVFLATWGPLPKHSARAMFSANLLAAGGLRSVDPGGADSVGTLVDAFREAGARVAVICGSDADYPAVVPELAGALQDAGAEAILVAGRPRAAEVEWRAAGVTDFIYMGCDARGRLADLHRVLSITSAAE